MSKTPESVMPDYVPELAASMVGSTQDDLHQDLYERFPTIPKKIIRKAFYKLTEKAYLGEIDTDNADDDQMDIYFLQEVEALLSK